MANNFVQVPPNSTGLKMQTFENTVGANVVESEAITLVRSSDNTEVGTAAQPLRVDPVGTTTQPVSGTVTSNQGTANGTPWNENVAQFGGNAVVTGVGNSGVGIPRVTTSSDSQINSLPLSVASVAGTTWTSATTINTTLSLMGSTTDSVALGWSSTGTFSTGAVTIEYSLDNVTYTPVPVGYLLTLNGMNSSQLGALGLPFTLSLQPTSVGILIPNFGFAFLRLRLTTAITNTGAVTWSFCSSSVNFTMVGGSATNGTGSFAPLAIAGLNANGNLAGLFTNGSASFAEPSSAAMLGTLPFISNGSLTTFVIPRTPSLFRGGQIPAAAGAVPIWTPVTGKKIRLMQYVIEAGEDCTITSGPLPVNLGFAFDIGVASAATMPLASVPSYTHRFVLPATVLATSFNGYQTDWISLGNGIIASTANQTLYAGLNVPQVIGAVTPTWTIAPTAQWEALTVGFKTLNSKGNFKLVQQVNAAVTSGTASTTITAAKGNAVFVIARTTNIAGGAPTMTISDNASNTYTTTQVTNASDSANGSSLYVGFLVNAPGGAGYQINAATSVHIATQVEIIVLEYAGVGSGGIDAAVVSATGSSTAPSSGAYTTATAGDLLLTAFATSTQMTSLPTINSSLFPRGYLSNATQGTLAVADNFGNAAMAAGVVNIVTTGTEE